MADKDQGNTWCQQMARKYKSTDDGGSTHLGVAAHLSVKAQDGGKSKVALTLCWILHGPFGSKFDFRSSNVTYFDKFPTNKLIQII